ncbi:sulfite reductase, partial [Geobacillus stearothermophilus]|nr:sulfite reductase [Geobacillus stearothermophilus]MED5044752.1 sulfite reductase [Geobacillus stearothermophilus]
RYTALRRNALACVALPTCGLAMAEAERYLPKLLDKIEEIIAENGLRDEEITIRMTGCPNGCARHVLAEIAFVGKAVGKYNMYLGAAFNGTRLGKLYRENIGEEEILRELRVLLSRYAKERLDGEHFGDFVIRAGIVKEVTDGTNFHD